MATVQLLLAVVAIVLCGLAAVGVGGRVNLLAAGVALFVLAWCLPLIDAAT